MIKEKRGGSFSGAFLFLFFVLIGLFLINFAFTGFVVSGTITIARSVEKINNVTNVRLVISIPDTTISLHENIPASCNILNYYTSPNLTLVSYDDSGEMFLIANESESGSLSFTLYYSLEGTCDSTPGYFFLSESDELQTSDYLIGGGDNGGGNNNGGSSNSGSSRRSSGSSGISSSGTGVSDSSISSGESDSLLTELLGDVKNNSSILIWIFVGAGVFILLIVLIIILALKSGKKQEMQNVYYAPVQTSQEQPLINPEAVRVLKDFIPKARQNNVSDDKIVSALLEKGWKKADIDEAMKGL